MCIRDSAAPAKSLPKGIDGKKRYLGKGVQSAVNNVKTVIAPVLAGMDACDQITICLLYTSPSPRDKRHLVCRLLLEKKKKKKKKQNKNHLFYLFFF